MRIQYIEGDLIKSDLSVICHGCNAKGSMGAGIAFHLRKPYPEIYDDYRRIYKEQGDRLDLGQTIWTRCRDGRTIINAITQATYGRDPNIVYVDYDAIRIVMQAINKAAKVEGFDRVGFPKIGAGLANGNWDHIAEIIEAEADAFQPVVYIFPG